MRNGKGRKGKTTKLGKPGKTEPAAAPAQSDTSRSAVMAAITPKTPNEFVPGRVERPRHPNGPLMNSSARPRRWKRPIPPGALFFFVVVVRFRIFLFLLPGVVAVLYRQFNVPSRALLGFQLDWHLATFTRLLLSLIRSVLLNGILPDSGLDWDRWNKKLYSLSTGRCLVFTQFCTDVWTFVQFDLVLPSFYESLWVFT